MTTIIFSTSSSREADRHGVAQNDAASNLRRHGAIVLYSERGSVSVVIITSSRNPPTRSPARWLVDSFQRSCTCRVTRRRPRTRCYTGALWRTLSARSLFQASREMQPPSDTPSPLDVLADATRHASASISSRHNTRTRGREQPSLFHHPRPLSAAHPPPPFRHPSATNPSRLAALIHPHSSRLFALRPFLRTVHPPSSTFGAPV
ncbi:hypothetical protein B0T11DRAFT_105732 [Plectosphaerella cucumerina]|uniref:Uncharacterized protein n=1 Tax=Plectosphaerella cucumerina TaxID=40658 RepID=A0A8K0TB15_9PEZI|nr:hypothetical protein B0T11DRAFT_105732 [Plectosphaerella cucumerina]